MNKYCRWLSPFCLVIIFFATLIVEWTGYQPLAQLAVGFLLLFALLEWKHLDVTAKIIGLLAMGLTVSLLMTATISFMQLSLLSGNVAFFAFFLIALSLLKEAALTSQSVSLTGQALLQQQPLKRYTLLTLASHLLGILMSMGAINLFGTMIQRSLELNKHNVDARINDARQRRMMQAVLRGFCSIPLWAPTTVTITLLVTTIPNLTWLDIMPYGLYLTLGILLFGIMLDYLQAPTYLKHLVPTMSNKLAELRVCLPILLVVLGLALVSGLLMLTSPLSAISAVLVSASVVSVLWIFFQYTRNHNHLTSLSLTRGRFSQQIFYSLTTQRNEIVFFAGSVLIGRLLLSVLDLDWLAAQLAALHISNAQLLILASWLIVIASLVFINPMISVTLVAGALAQLPALQHMPVAIALVMMVTWTAVIGSAPSATSVRIGASMVKVSAFQLGIKWNGLYSLMVLLALDVYLLFCL